MSACNEFANAYRFVYKFIYELLPYVCKTFVDLYIQINIKNFRSNEFRNFLFNPRMGSDLKGSALSNSTKVGGKTV